MKIITVKRRSGLRMYFSFQYWYLKIKFAISGCPSLEIIETFTIFTDDEENIKH
jgi:hypothetical protein